MRVRITFKVNNRGGLVPFHHQYLIAQIIKGLLISERNLKFKDYPFYSFSGVKGQTKVSKNGLQYNSRKVTIVISSASGEFIEYLTDLILQQEQIAVGGLFITPELVEEELPINLETGSKYVCISPLVLLPPSFNSDEGKRFIDPSSDEFSDILYESTIKRMASYGIDVASIPEIQKFQIVPDEGYLSKIRASNKKFARIYPIYDQDVKYEARGYTFPFTLYAAPEIQDFLFTCGFGSYCHKGFGMLDVANSDPTQRTVIYRTKSQLISA